MRIIIMKAFQYTMILVVLATITACAPALEASNTAKLMALTAPQSLAREYVIQPGDTLEIKFFYNPELNELVTVRPDGRISIQLANEIMVSGLTPAELNEKLRVKYSENLEKPEITVLVRTFTSQRIYVDGEVNRAGLVTLTAPMTILQSISQAGGFKETASKENIIIIRRTVDNQLTTMKVNLGKAIDNTDISQDIVLMPNDIVHVPRSGVANLNLWVDQYLRRNIPIPFTYSLGGL